MTQGIILFLLFFIAAMLSLHVVFGEQYRANLTGEEWQEYKLTELCYTMDGSKLTVELLEKFCDERYGDIDSFYGDKIK